MDTMDLIYIVSVAIAVGSVWGFLKIVYRNSIVEYVGNSLIIFGFECTTVTYIYASSGVLAHALWIVPLTFILMVFVFRFLHLNIRIPLKDITEAGNALAGKDISFRMDIIKKEHELGDLSVSISTIMENLHAAISEIVETAHTISETAESLAVKSDELLSDSNIMTEKSGNTVAATVDISNSLNEIVTSVEQASNNLDTISSAAEEMSSTINEIAHNTDMAKLETESVVKISNESMNRVMAFEKQTEEIGNIITAINEISEQTKLLGLNATIEAARAGEAGKGFAVVASEVKELARQSTESATSINNMINNVKLSIYTTVKDSQTINSSIENISNIVTNIASSVEEQSVTTKDIAQNITRASSGISEASKNITKTSEKVKSITKDTVETDRICGKVSGLSKVLNTTAMELSNIAGVLSALSEEFKL